MRDVFKNGRQGFTPSPAYQALESRSDQPQTASGVGAPESALVLLPAGISLPVTALTAPVCPDHLRHGLRALVFLIPTRDEMAGEIFLLRRLAVLGLVLVGRVIGRFEQLPGFGKVSALRVGADTA